MKMKIDTCSDVNIIDEITFTKLKDVIKLEKTNIKLYGYNASSPLKIIGKFRETIESKHRLTSANFYVVPGKSGSLINSDTAEALHLISFFYEEN